MSTPEVHVASGSRPREVSGRTNAAIDQSPYPLIRLLTDGRGGDSVVGG